MGIIVDFIPDNKTDMFFLFLIGALGLFSLFNFKNRKLQKNINYLNIITNLLLIGFMVYSLCTSSGEFLNSMKGVELLIPILLIILLAMANKYISKDERLVKSVDRFR